MESTKIVKERIIEKLKTVHDPEIPVNIYDLGLIYEIRFEGDSVSIDMTLTSPGCPVGDLLLQQVKLSVMSLDNISEVDVNLVFDPPWDQNNMSEEAKLELGVF